jgi:hypothetical protein
MFMREWEFLFFFLKKKQYAYFICVIFFSKIFNVTVDSEMNAKASLTTSFESDENYYAAFAYGTSSDVLTDAKQMFVARYALLFLFFFFFNLVYSC